MVAAGRYFYSNNEEGGKLRVILGNVVLNKILRPVVKLSVNALTHKDSLSVSYNLKLKHWSLILVDVSVCLCALSH